jgi:hypothetical protein
VVLETPAARSPKPRAAGGLEKIKAERPGDHLDVMMDTTTGVQLALPAIGPDFGLAAYRDIPI